MTKTHNTCTYIGTAQGNHSSCTKHTLAGKSYCEEHMWLVYQKGTARATRHKEVRTVDKVRLVESMFNDAVAQLEAEGFDCYGDSEKSSNRFEEAEA